MMYPFLRKFVLIWEKLDDSIASMTSAFNYKRLGDMIWIVSTFAIAAFGTLETTTFLMYDAVEIPVSEQSNLEFYTYFSKKSLFVETSTAIFTSIDDAKCSICECINVSVTTLSVLAIFLSCFQYFKTTKIKSVVFTKLRIV